MFEKRHLRIMTVSLCLALFTTLLACTPVYPDNSWTFMIYLDSANNLDDYGMHNFAQMVNGLNGMNNPAINVLVLVKRIPTYATSTEFFNTAWTGTRLYRINQNGTVSELTDFYTDSPGEKEATFNPDMGSPDTLQSFIQYSKANYPANHFALVLWDHGGGSRNSKLTLTTPVKGVPFVTSSTVSAFRDIAEDESTGNAIFTGQLGNVLSLTFSQKKLDFLGFDACLMGTAEVAYQLRDSVEVVAGSMADEWGPGWDYEALFSSLKSAGVPNDDPRELGKLVVQMYHDTTLAAGRTDQTMAAYDLTHIADVKESANALATALDAEVTNASDPVMMQEVIEATRDSATHFYSGGQTYEIAFPYMDFAEFCSLIATDPKNRFSTNLRTKCQAVIDAITSVVVYAYAGASYDGYYGDGATVKRGLSVFFSRGNIMFDSGYGLVSEYFSQWWYTDRDTQTWWGKTGRAYMYGHIDFADTNGNGVVDTWAELCKKWYDSSGDGTPGSY